MAFDEDADAVGQSREADVAFAAGRGRRGGLRRAARRRDHHPIEPLRNEPAAGGGADFLGGHFLNVLDVGLIEQRIGGGEEAAAEAFRRLLHGLAVENPLHGLLLLRLGEFVGADQFLAQAVDFAENRRGGRLPLLGQATGGDGEIAADVVRRLAFRGDRKDELLVVLQPLRQPRAFALAEDAGRQVQGVHVRVGELDAGPGEDHVVGRALHFADRLAGKKLRRLVDQGDVGLEAARRAGPLLRHAVQHVLRAKSPTATNT